MKKTKFLCLIIAAAAIISTLICFSSCSASMDSTGNFAPESTPEIGDNVDLEFGDVTVGDTDAEYQRKIIKTARISAETRKFEDSIARIEELCANAGGYVESSSVSGNKLDEYNGAGRRSASYTLRIPAEGFDEFNTEIGSLLNVVRSSSNVDEVTNKYYDIQSRIDVLELQKKSLQDMYDNYTDYKDIDTLLRLQNQLYDVIEEIEAYKTQLRLYDSKIAYSTVYLDITEVAEYTETEEDTPFLEELKDAFFGGVGFAWTLLKGVAIVIAAVTPVFLPLLVLVIVIVIVVKVVIKRKRRSK